MLWRGKLRGLMISSEVTACHNGVTNMAHPSVASVVSTRAPCDNRNSHMSGFEIGSSWRRDSYQLPGRRGDSHMAHGCRQS